MGETAVSWQTWSDGAGSVPTIDGDADWGKLKLDYNPGGEEGRSAVYDLGSTKTRKFTITENRYGTGSGSASIQIRGSGTYFNQDDVSPDWEFYTTPISRTWRYVQIRATTIEHRLSMWVWPQNLKTKADCDEMITFANGRFTDLFVFYIDDSVTPRTWLGTGTLGTTNATVIEGKTPWAYVYDSAHALGIRVHAWAWLSSFYYFGGTNGLDSDIPDNATYNDAGVWNFHDATARAKMIEEIVDFFNNNDVDGFNFNHESTTANITEQDLTDFMTALRTAIPGYEFSFCTGASVADDATLKMNIDGWLSSGVIDTAVLMGYYDCLEIKDYYVSTLGVSKNKIIAGIGFETNKVESSDIKHRWLMLEGDNYDHYALFCWGSNIDDDINQKNLIDDYLSDTLSATQNPITKVSVTPGTSWTITVGGADQTTNYADVTDHLYSTSLKQHIEAAIGSTNPAIIYFRNNSTTTKILIGDFEP